MNDDELDLVEEIQRKLKQLVQRVRALERELAFDLDDDDDDRGAIADSYEVTD